MKSWSEITHYAGPDGMAISGTDLYVSNFSAGTVTAYSATTGLAIAGFTTISWISEPQGLATSGTDLCASTLGNNAVVEYNAITGGDHRRLHLAQRVERSVRHRRFPCAGAGDLDNAGVKLRRSSPPSSQDHETSNLHASLTLSAAAALKPGTPTACRKFLPLRSGWARPSMRQGLPRPESGTYSAAPSDGFAHSQ